MIFKVEAQGDTMYIQAADQLAAKNRLFDMVGEMPDRILKWTEVKKLPEGEEFL
jgi:hypothetical protein